ncbi:MAG: tyrosine protein kinase, partial [Bacteroides sp.]
MSEEQFNYNKEEEADHVDIRELMLNYLSHWKWFVVSILVCFALSILYLRCTPEEYNVSSTVILKDDDKGGASNELAMFEGLGLMNSKNNVDNEIE